MNFFKLAFSLLFISANVFGQQAAITGKISSLDGQPVPYISVTLKNKSFGTSSNKLGVYLINNIKPGLYTIQVSGIGLTSIQKTIQLFEGNNTVDFTIQEDKQTLREIAIEGRKNGYKINKPSASLRLNELILEVPQNIQIIGRQAFEDQQITSMSDGVTRNVSGAVRTEHWGDLYTNIKMRGSQVQAFRNGFNVVSSFWGPLTEDMSTVDHIEFVKGPAGFMLSNGDPSGLYNVVTKKPTGSNKGYAEFTTGSFDLYRATVDIDRRITDNGKLLLRVNAAAQNKKSFRPYEENNRYTFAPSLSYQLTNSTKLTAEYTLQNAIMTEIGSYYVFGSKYAQTPINFTITHPDMPKTRVNDHSLFLNLQQTIGSNWKITAQAAYFKYLQNGYDMWPNSISNDGKIIRSVFMWDAESTMKLGQLFINGEAKTGAIQHRILAGFDAGKKDYMADWGQRHKLDLPSQPFDIYHPNYGPPSNGMPHFDRSTPLIERAAKINAIWPQKYISTYVQDELGFFKNRIRLTLAGRYTYISQSTWGEKPDEGKKITPRIGLSISLDKTAAVYALYDQAFIPQSGILRNGTSTNKALTGNNIEVGAKKDWADGRWNTSIAVYRIIKQNELTSDPNNAPLEIYKIVLGEKIAEGIEFDLKGELLKGLMVTANYAYTDGRVTKATPGVTEISVGQIVPGFVKHVANTWLSYKLVNGVLKGLGINAGVAYWSGRATDWGDGLEKLPNYSKLDAGLSYEKNKFSITGNVFNVLNTYNYSGGYYSYLSAYYWQAEAPRNFRLSIGYKF